MPHEKRCFTLIIKSGLTKRAPDAGESVPFLGFFYALAFFWLDGFAVPAPAQVTQTVRRLADEAFKIKRQYEKKK